MSIPNRMREAADKFDKISQRMVGPSLNVYKQRSATLRQDAERIETVLAHLEAPSTVFLGEPAHELCKQWALMLKGETE